MHSGTYWGKNNITAVSWKLSAKHTFEMFAIWMELEKKQTSKRSTTSAWAEKRSDKRVHKAAKVCILSRRWWNQECQLAWKDGEKANYCVFSRQESGWWKHVELLQHLTHGRRSSQFVPSVFVWVYFHSPACCCSLSFATAATFIQDFSSPPLALNDPCFIWPHVY